MENNLLNNIKSYFNDDVLNKLASRLGIEKEQVQRGVDISIPSLLLGLQSRNQDGLSSILTSAKHLFSTFNPTNTLGRYFSDDDLGQQAHFESDNLVSSIFGDKLNNIIQSVSQFIGVHTDSIRGLFGASMPAVIAGLTGKGAHWDVTEIAQKLNLERSSFASAIPAGLGLGAFGDIFAKANVATELPSPSANPEPAETIRKPIVPPVVHTQESVSESKKGAGLWWLLIPIIALALWFLLGKSCGNGTTSNQDTTSNQTLIPDTVIKKDTTVLANTLVDVPLPNGSTLKAYPAGIEEQVINFLQSDYKNWTENQLKDKWFDFDNLNFETGTANIMPESQVQLENIAAILRLFPDAKIKIGGYTDKTGDEAINKKLSQQRADAVKHYLEAQNLGGQVVGAEGYGSEFAKISSTASDEERAKDRRVAISIRK